MLLTGYLPVSHCCIYALVTQMFLEQSQAIARVVCLYSFHRERVSKSMGTNVVHLPCLWINQFRESSSLSALFYDLPSTVPIDTKNEQLSILKYGTTTVDIFP